MPIVSVVALASLRPVANTSSVEEPVILPSTSERTAPAMSASVTITVMPATPTFRASAFAVALFVPDTLASTLTSPVELRVASGPTTAVMSAPFAICAVACAPLMPMTATPITSTVAVAVFKPIAWTRMPLELLTVPSADAVVAPETMANGSMMSIDTPPAVPPGAVAVALSVEIDWTVTMPVVDSALSPVDVVWATVERPLFARATVRPAANAPVFTLIVWALTS